MKRALGCILFELCNLHAAYIGMELTENDFKINKAINLALTKKGPLHINAPFEEPLYETVEELSVSPNIFEFPEVSNSIPIEDNTIGIEYLSMVFKLSSTSGVC